MRIRITMDVQDVRYYALVLERIADDVRSVGNKITAVVRSRDRAAAAMSRDGEGALANAISKADILDD